MGVDTDGPILHLIIGCKRPEVHTHYSFATMFHTLCNVQRGEAIPLEQYINNHGGCLQVGLQNFTLTVGWYNVPEGVSFREWNKSNSLTKTFRVPPRFYGFRELKAVLESSKSDVLLEANPVNGVVSVTIGSGWELNLPAGLITILGLNPALAGRQEWITSGTHMGVQSLDFVIPRWSMSISTRCQQLKI